MRDSTRTPPLSQGGKKKLASLLLNQHCCALLVIDKGPNKGLLFDPNKGSNLEHPVVFFLLTRIFTTANFWILSTAEIQPHDGFITQWVFSFLPLHPSRNLSTDSHSATDRDCGSPHIVGFSFFTTNHINLNGSTRWGFPFRPLPWAQSLILTVHGLGLIPQRHTHGSKSVSIVQGLVQDLNVYKTHGV